MKNTMKKGFTLVELLFVMAIISIIAGIGAYSISDINKDKSYFNLEHELKNTKIELLKYFDTNKTFKGFETSKDIEIVVATKKNFCIQKELADVIYRFDLNKDAYVTKAKCIVKNSEVKKNDFN